MKKSPKKSIRLVANGDLRQSANEATWSGHQAMEHQLTAAVARLAYKLVRAHPYKPALKHGFIASQKEGMAVFATPAASKKSGTSVADVKVTQPGPIGLGCHLHSSMRGQVYVSATPWFGKTDANGVLKLDGLPDGHADITIWHPDQLQEQAALKAQIGSQPAEASGSLNFTPRRRRA